MTYIECCQRPLSEIKHKFKKTSSSYRRQWFCKFQLLDKGLIVNVTVHVKDNLKTDHLKKWLTRVKV